MTSVPFDIPINDDDILEGNENFTLNIDSSSLLDGAGVGHPNQATVTIVDNDGKCLKWILHLGFTLSLSLENTYLTVTSPNFINYIISSENLIRI